MMEERIDIKKAPLRKITGHRCHPRNSAVIVEVLECGHWLNIKTDIYGETNAYRRRCWKCARGWPEDANEPQKEKKEILPKKNRPVYQRLGTVPLEEVLPFVVFDCRDRRSQRKEYFGQRVKMASDRLRCFAKHGTKCVHCGIEGKFFAVERHFAENSGYHLNLYAVKDGEEVLMTKDHIVPLAKGGKNRLKNYQTMCTDCNIEKGDKKEGCLSG